jgi:hypothetical protein
MPARVMITVMIKIEARLSIDQLVGLNSFMILLILVSVDLSIWLFWGFGCLETVSYICIAEPKPMNSDQLRKLSVTELEKLVILQKRILDFTIFYEHELLEEASRRELEETKNNALDKLNLLITELKKRAI